MFGSVERMLWSISSPNIVIRYLITTKPPCHLDFSYFSRKFFRLLKFNSDLVNTEVNKWSLLFQKGTLLAGFAFFHSRVNPEANFCHMTMSYISFFISRTMRNFLSGQICYLTSRKFFWDSRSGLMRQIFNVMLPYFTFFIASFFEIREKSLSPVV